MRFCDKSTRATGALGRPSLRRVAFDGIRSRRAIAISGRRMTNRQLREGARVSAGVTGGKRPPPLHLALRRVATPTMFNTRMKL